MTDNKNLKALCAAAPTGPWLVENDSLYFKDDGYTRHLLDADAGHDVEDEDYYAALKFIAAANPDAVLALVAENKALRKDAERYQWLRDKSENLHGFYLSTPIWMTGVKFSKENVDSTIDGAMGKGEQQ